jgi:hypothetical protein
MKKRILIIVRDEHIGNAVENWKMAATLVATKCRSPRWGAPLPKLVIRQFLEPRRLRV